MARELAIEIAFDVICPWLPFELNPDLPAGGMPRAEYRRAKFGSPERAKQLDARVAAEGHTVGIEFAFEPMERTPNTRAAHELIDLAQREGKANEVVDALFRAYFEEANDIGDGKVLAAIAARHGVSGWPGQARHEEVNAIVPTFIFDRKLGVLGAHRPEHLAQAIRQALGEAT